MKKKKNTVDTACTYVTYDSLMQAFDSNSTNLEWWKESNSGVKIVDNSDVKIVDNSDDYLKVHLITSTPEAKRVAFSAIRTCYSPDTAKNLFEKEFYKYEAKNGDDLRLIKEIVGHGHTSTLEHITFTFGIESLSRACLAQLTRHRIGWSYSVQSQRYVKQNSGSKHGEAGFVYPKVGYLDEVKKDKAGQYFAEALIKAQEYYDMLVELGVKAEDARAVLPMNSTCNLVVSCNLRAFMDFYGKRKKGTHAQEEISELAEKMKNRIIEAEPWIGELF